MTFQEMGFPEAFADSTEVHWHWVTKGEYYQTPDIYLTSANALSESGEAVNIDGTCNRVAGTLYGPKQCMFVCGINKLCPDLASAVERARNVAAPKNAQRLGTRTPCAADGKCHDCKSPGAHLPCAGGAYGCAEGVREMRDRPGGRVARLLRQHRALSVHRIYS